MTGCACYRQIERPVKALLAALRKVDWHDRYGPRDSTTPSLSWRGQCQPTSSVTPGLSRFNNFALRHERRPFTASHSCLSAAESESSFQRDCRSVAWGGQTAQHSAAAAKSAAASYLSAQAVWPVGEALLKNEAQHGRGRL